MASPSPWAQSTVNNAQQQPQTIIPESPEIFMGGKASESFTQLILNAMNHGSARMASHSFSSPREAIGDIHDRMDLLVPPPDARRLITIYFDFHHILTPIFHVPTVLAQFEQVYSCDPAQLHEYAYSIALINMMCAIAAAHNRPGQGTSEKAEPIARRYYEVAMLLVQPTLFVDWSIEKVQILLLGTRYLQAASYPEECWNVLGLALRVAYGLELHRPPDPTQFDCVAQEVRKRVWAACYGLDQLLSMIYGRPASISAATFSMPLPEDLDDDCIQPARLLYPSVRSPSTMSFFIAVSKLYRILESAASLSKQPTLEDIVQLDEEFETWRANLPPNLKIQAGTRVEDDKVLILALRANTVRILIHRQSLAVVLSALSEATHSKMVSWERTEDLGHELRKSMLRRSRQICVSTAENTIELVAQRHEPTSAMGPSWFNLYYRTCISH